MAKIDTGDFVRQISTNELHLVAMPPQNDDPWISVFSECKTFPEVLVLSTDCYLHAKATPVARLQVLHELAKLRDCRGAYARLVLSTPSQAD